MCALKNISYKDTDSKNLFIVSGIKFCVVNTNSEQTQDVKQLSQKIRFFEKELVYFEKKLSNKNFVDKAPKEVVEIEKKKLAEVRKTLNILKGLNV